MKAIVIGATGATGRELVELLLKDDRFQEVVALTRKGHFNPHNKLKEVIIDFDKMQEYSSFVQGDIAFSCLGTTLKIAGSKTAQWRVDHDYQLAFANMCHANAVPDFVLLSAVGVGEKSLFFYNKMKGTLETNVKRIPFQHLTIVQPGMIIRPNSDRPMEVLGEKVIMFLNKLGLFKGYRAITTKQLAKSLISFGTDQMKALQVVTVKQIFTRLKS